MSRENNTTDNAVGERFMRNFKQHKIDGVTSEEKMQSNLYSNRTVHYYILLLQLTLTVDISRLPFNPILE